MRRFILPEAIWSRAIPSYPYCCSRREAMRVRMVRCVGQEPQSPIDPVELEKWCEAGKSVRPVQTHVGEAGCVLWVNEDGSLCVQFEDGDERLLFREEVDFSEYPRSSTLYKTSHRPCHSIGSVCALRSRVLACRPWHTTRKNPTATGQASHRIPALRRAVVQVQLSFHAPVGRHRQMKMEGETPSPPAPLPVGEG